jgi:hypothetical protein
VILPAIITPNLELRNPGRKNLLLDPRACTLCYVSAAVKQNFMILRTFNATFFLSNLKYEAKNNAALLVSPCGHTEGNGPRFENDCFRKLCNESA